MFEGDQESFAGESPFLSPKTPIRLVLFGKNGSCSGYNSECNKMKHPPTRHTLSNEQMQRVDGEKSLESIASVGNFRKIMYTVPETVAYIATR